MKIHTMMSMSKGSLTINVDTLKMLNDTHTTDVECLYTLKNKSHLAYKYCAENQKLN